MPTLSSDHQGRDPDLQILNDGAANPRKERFQGLMPGQLALTRPLETSKRRFHRTIHRTQRFGVLVCGETMLKINNIFDNGLT